MYCKYNQTIWEQPIKCEVEDCENCRFNPNLTAAQVQGITDKYTEELLGD